MIIYNNNGREEKWNNSGEDVICNGEETHEMCVMCVICNV
jgi:hypothetical protein